MTKIDGTPIDDGEHLDLVVPMYNLIECSSNFSETVGINLTQEFMVLFKR